jgi:hypothetical protein
VARGGQSEDTFFQISSDFGGPIVRSRQRSAKPSSRVRFPPSPQFQANREILKTTGRGSLDLCRAIGGFAGDLIGVWLGPRRRLRDRGPLRIFRVALRSDEVMTAKEGSRASAER